MVDILDTRLSTACPVPPPVGRQHAAATDPGMDAALAVSTVEDAEGFESLRTEWRELLEDSDADCIFLTWEWLHTWWKHLAGGRRLHLITVRRGGALVGIAPLAVRPRQPERLFPFHALEFLGTGSVGSDYLDLIIRHGEAEAVLQAIGSHLGDCRLMLELSQVKLTTTHAGRFAARLMDAGWHANRTVTEMCPYIDLAGYDWESFLGTLGPAHRNNVRRRLKNLRNSFAVSWIRASTEEERRHCLRALVDLHHARWATRTTGSDALHNQALIDFHDEWSRLALARGWLRLGLLSLDGAPAAAVYAFRYRDVVHFYQSGFDPGYSAHSVGLAALAMSIRDALEEGAVEYDLLHGSENYKFLWASEARDLSRLNLYPPNSHGLLYRQAIQLRQSVKKAIHWPRQASAN